MGTVVSTLDLDPARRCMLLERVTEVFDEIPMVNAVQRVVIVGKGVQSASQSNEAVKSMIGETNFIAVLHAEAKTRMTGKQVLPAALRSEFGVSKEAERV